ncbi:LysE family translocator [Piscinibacter sp. XHJ-5]|uniref:LysE family translocator n=1 Tax=Piscinibacter sp. XHJ-5 TaxID=3037797 RepID=UPI0024532E7D|nr:LysE family translocator [Piscinibacter sp. XHJ-5]
MTELLPLLTYSFLMSSTPGPNNVMLTASGANFGYRRTLPHILGIAAGHGPQIFLTCLGLGALFLRIPVLHDALRVAGALWLVWIAWKLAGSAVGGAELQRPLSFVQALAFQMVNPKGWIKAITLAAVFMPAGLDVVSGALLVTAVSIAINLPCVSMWALFGVAISRWLTDARRRRGFNVIMAVSLLILAVTLLV